VFVSATVISRKEKPKGATEHFFVYRIKVSIHFAHHSLPSWETGMDENA
jgi:hypothetical protein